MSEEELLYCKECNCFVYDNFKAGFHLVCGKPLYKLVKVGKEGRMMREKDEKETTQTTKR